MSRLIGLVVAGTLALGASAAFAAEPQIAAGECGAPPTLTAIEPSLSHAAVQVAQHRPLTIVAVGSSSTQGVGASVPALNYPNRLAAELQDRFPESQIRVVNRGKGGEDVAEELARLSSEVIAENPDLVIWQVGTNAVLRRDDLATDGDMIRRGIELLKPIGADIVLMDLQYAPRVLQRPGYTEMERLIANAAKQERVGLFRRFELMQYWQAAQPDGPAMIGPDALHMNDRGYRCLAQELAESLASNWRSYQQSVQRLPAPAVAGLSGKPAHPSQPTHDGAE
jgi:acyl-CoA thioesterase-1